MKIFKSLPFRLLLGIIVGGALGLYCQSNIEQTAGFMQLIVCINRLLNQFIMFCVPLIVLGFICPSIVKMGTNVEKLLGFSLILAYLSSVLAAMMSMIAGYKIIPMLKSFVETTKGPELPTAVFQLDIQQIMPVITALVFSIVIGLAVVWTKSKTWASMLEEFQNIVLIVVEKVVIPILPYYIATTFIMLGYDGTISNFPIYLIAILIVMIGHYVWLFILYFVAGVYSGQNPIEVIKHYGPAYITAVGTMSSAATLSVALKCANKSKVLPKDIVSFGVPLFANIHLCGSVLTETFFVMIIYLTLVGSLPPVSTMILFVILLGIFAVGAPGVPGGTVMASLGIVSSVVFAGQVPEVVTSGTVMLLAIFALQDSFGTACNVTADGALTLMVAKFAGRFDNSPKKKVETKTKSRTSSKKIKK